MVLIAAIALGIGAASFASVSGTRFGDVDGARSLSLSKCRTHILSERGRNIASKDIAESPTRSGTPRRKTTSQQDNKTIRQLKINSQSYAVPEPVEGKIRRFDKLSDQSTKSQKSRAKSISS